jgi:hypothetical protein
VPSFQTNLVEAPPGSAYRGSTGKSDNRRVAGGGCARSHVIAVNGKTRRHAQTGPGRAMHCEPRVGYAEGSRTHYLAGSETHRGNWHAVLAI